MFNGISSQKVLLIFAFLLYCFLILELVGTILEKPKLKKWQRVPLGICNVLLAVGVSFVPGITVTAAYIIYGIVMTAEFALFHKDTILRVIFVSLSCTIHIMTVRAAVVSVFSMITNLSVHVLQVDGFWNTISLSVVFLFLSIAILLVLKFVSAKSIKIINQHKEQLFFMTGWLVVANLYFLFNASVYSDKWSYLFVVKNQLAISIVILMGVYITLYFTIRTGNLLHYEEQHDEMRQAMENEQQFRDAVTNDSIAIYEANLTKDILAKGFDESPELREKYHYKYSLMLEEFNKQVIHPDYQSEFLHYASIDNLLKEFQSGKSETELEYKRIMPDGRPLWVKIVINLFCETMTGDIKAFAYVKDIHKEKVLELELKNKAERDFLTGLYNKGTTENLITEFIISKSEHAKKGALMIIDIDDFKVINDRFGHTFGDAVLSELADKLRNIFRNGSTHATRDYREDIIGRVGGDEFIVFIKNTNDLETLNTKAKSVCKAFSRTYQRNGEMEVHISSSIGIAKFPQSGDSFEKLYKGADVALYLSKNKGKNTFSFYDGEEFSGYESERGVIDVLDEYPQKSFQDNRIEYLFKILFDVANPINAVQSVLQLMTSSTNFSRGYIFEMSEDGMYSNNTYEWCAEGVKSQMDKLQNIPQEAISTATNAFYKDGYFIMKNLQLLPQMEQDILEPQGIKYMLQFGMFEGGKLMGFVGFDDCEQERSTSQGEINEMSILCNILTTFIMKQRSFDRANREQRMFSTVMNNLNTFTYVVEPSTYKILFTNQKSRSKIKEEQEEFLCHKVFRGTDRPCEECPIRQLTETKVESDAQMYNDKMNIWVNVTAKKVEWVNGEVAIVVTCVDVSKFKNG